MADQNNGAVQLQPQELDAVYTLSQAVASAISTEAALDKIVKIARPIFIFDNIVLYEKLPENGLDPTYARAIGRGRFREADLAWGEVVANEAFQNGRTTTQIRGTGRRINRPNKYQALLGFTPQACRAI